MIDRFFVGLFEVLTLLGCLIGGALVILAIMPGASAPQAGAMAAIGVGFAVVPYCLAGMVHRSIIRKVITKDGRDL